MRVEVFLAEVSVKDGPSQLFTGDSWSDAAPLVKSIFHLQEGNKMGQSNPAKLRKQETRTISLRLCFYNHVPALLSPVSYL